MEQTEQDFREIERARDLPPDEPRRSAVIDNLVQYSLTKSEVATLVRMGLIVEFDDPEATDCYELTAILWDDLELDENQAYKLFDHILGRPEAAI